MRPTGASVRGWSQTDEADVHQDPEEAIMKGLLWGGTVVLSIMGGFVALDGFAADGFAASRSDATSTGNPVPEPRPSRENETTRVAKLLDGVIQPRFLQDAGEFGVRRLLTLNGHEAVTFHAQNKQEQKVLDQVNAAGRDYF